MSVVIFGCGPSGLLAAHAAALHREEFYIVSVKRPSQLFGCQYLHDAIPGLRSTRMAPVMVDYQLRGTPEEYAEKVYGPEAAGLRVSPSVLLGKHPAWDIRSTYQELWDLYHLRIIDEKVVPEEVPAIMNYFWADRYITTIPAPSLCSNPGHSFRSTTSWAVGDAPELGQEAPSSAPEFTVVCDGTKDVGYYRDSNVFGYATVEWPGWRSKPPIRGVVPFEKPLRTTCDCWPEIRRVGRYGKWEKGVLAHHAFEEAMRIIEERHR